MHTNITNFIQIARIFKILLYIYSQNVNINVGMNNKVTINPKAILKYDFRHIFTYKLLYHIMVNYNTGLCRVYLNRKELVEKYNVSDYSIIKAIGELVNNNIINSYSYCVDWYVVNKKVFINFVKDTI